MAPVTDSSRQPLPRLAIAVHGPQQGSRCFQWRKQPPLLFPEQSRGPWMSSAGLRSRTVGSRSGTDHALTGLLRQWGARGYWGCQAPEVLTSARLGLRALLVGCHIPGLPPCSRQLTPTWVEIEAGRPTSPPPASIHGSHHSPACVEDGAARKRVTGHCGPITLARSPAPCLGKEVCRPFSPAPGSSGRAYEAWPPPLSCQVCGHPRVPAQD